MRSWLTGIIAVLDGSTRSGELPNTLPVFSSAWHDKGGGEQARQVRIEPRIYGPCA